MKDFNSLSDEWLTKIALLKPREMVVFRYIGYCLENKEIAEKLFISKSTVKKHIEAIYKALQCRNRSHISLISFLYFNLKPDVSFTIDNEYSSLV